MKIQALHMGMKVRHPQYGVGVIRGIAEHTTDVMFDDGKRIIDPDAGGLESAEAQAEITGLDIPLATLIDQIVDRTMTSLGVAKPDAVVEELGPRWNGGKLLMHPADTALQPKEVPLETFFHKIVMMRNNLRTLEAKLNAHEKLTDGDKVELQQYITRCYGSMTTFNLLFRNKEDQFGG